MKIRNLFLTVLAAGATATGFCQSQQAAATNVMKAPPSVTQADFLNVTPMLTERQIADIARFQSETVSRVLGVNVKLDGVIPQAFRVKKPLHLINPFAPAEYGSGWENVTTDPQTGQANGIRFLGIRF